ncbi:phosphoglycolate phosphatase [Ideonella livida]|uniref:Phosphoglycolate phosphatase n=1 Tax=Ideonella livida TaxID=2707176 RepID=A0A7C9PHC8_9BURK|nr:phosphoglycolate phosphatase [Ideonella livida]NDY91074.1 phosphoglycolate phosphatase [Ideonella livida]
MHNAAVTLPDWLHRGRFDVLMVDLDGTLVDTLGDFDAALNRMLAGLGLPGVDRAFIERTVGKGSEHLVRRTLAEVGAQESRYEAAWTLYQDSYAAINGECSSVYPGAREALAAWQAAGFRLACLTNKPGEAARTLLQRKGLDVFFEVTFGGDAFARKKPDPLPLLSTCAHLGVDPSRALMVGDSENDVLAARAAGCAVAVVPYGYNHGQPIASAGADWLMRQLDRP